MKMFGILGLLSVVVATADVVPNSCTDLEDGTYVMKFIDSDDYPLVSVKCSNGFAILDYSLDNEISSYFDTFSQWFPHTGGPSNDVHLNWKQWFLPHVVGDTDSKTQYILSPDCTSCEATHKRQIYHTDTTYWMTGSIFGCFWSIKGAHNCDYDYDSTGCYTCDTVVGNGASFTEVTDDTTIPDYEKTGICPHNVRTSGYYTPTLHDQCSEEESGISHLKPSLGLEGAYCVCFQQSSTEYFEVSADDIEEVSNRLNEEDNTVEVVEKAGQYKLYQSDFEDGTYRITKSGTYSIMEDIIFDFNSNEDSPNAEYAYLPEVSQNDDYPGAGEYRNAYFLGFFAGITIETDDVVLDLNGYTLAMSEYFYHQQRWFTTIELSTQYFLPGQGIGNFGGEPSVASNVVIKNGVLGLSSHHGIHGNDNKNIEISDLKVQHFETHGIQLNGFENVKMMNVEIGPTSDIVKFSGEYAHMRQLMPRYRQIANEMEDDLLAGDITEDDLYIQFYGRDEATTMNEIAEEIALQMDLAWDYVMDGKEVEMNDANYDSFVSAKKLFVNNNGYLPLGAAQYGMFLNTFGASIFTYNMDTSYYSSKATLENIKIHGMKHSMIEYFMFGENGNGNFFINPFNAPLNVNEMVDGLSEINDYDEAAAILENPTYKGNILLDAAIASNKFSNSFNYLALQILKNDFIVPWAIGDDLSTVSSDTVELTCAVDAMIHTSKGINGLRLDGIEEISIKNVEIYDLHDLTPVGSDNCGDYDTSFRQTLPMQTGFSGNMNQAININAAKTVTIENARVHNIESNTGQAFGISIWPACDVTLKGDIIVFDLKAGSQVEEGTYSYDDLPNAAPEVCGVRVYYQYGDYTTDFDDSEANYQIVSNSLHGHAGCFGYDKYDTVSKDEFLAFAEEDEKLSGKVTEKVTMPLHVKTGRQASVGVGINHNDSGNDVGSYGGLAMIIMAAVIMILALVFGIRIYKSRISKYNKVNENTYVYDRVANASNYGTQ